MDSSIATRDKDAILKTYSGLIKILFPSGECTKEESKELLKFAIEGRKRVKNQLLIIDETFSEVDFSFYDNATKEKLTIKTLEELQYPQLIIAKKSKAGIETKEEQQSEFSFQKQPQSDAQQKSETPKETHLIIEENQIGMSYEKLFTNYLIGAKEIIVRDPYIRQYYQVKNFMEFCEMILKVKPATEEIAVKLFTKLDPEYEQETRDRLEKVFESLDGSGINFEYEVDMSEGFHARSITTDTGWKILLDRGLDIFQPYNYKDALSLATSMQEKRMCKRFEVTYLKI